MLQQQRHAAAALDLAARRLDQAGGEPQQRRLARAVASHQRDALARRERAGRRRAGPPARAELEPHALEGERGAESWGGAAARAGVRLRASAALVGGAAQPAGAQRGARLLHRDRRRAEAGRANSRAPGVCGPAAPLEEAARVGVERHGAVLSAITRSAAARQRSSRCSASRTAVPHSSLRRRRTPSSSSPATGSSCEVGSSSSSSRGRPASAAPSATRCSSPPDSSCVGAVEQAGDAERERRLLHPARDRRRAPAAVLERERELGAHRAHHDLRLGVLEQRPGDRGQLGRAVLARVEPAGHEPPGELAAVEVRHEPGGGAQQRRLARARAAREHDELARLDRSARRRPAPAAPPGIRVGHPLEDELAHRPIPRRSANGSSATASSATASASSAGADRHHQRGYAANDSQPPSDRRDPEPGEQRRVDAANAKSWRDHGRVPPRRARRAAEAAHLERRGDVGRAVQRARGHRRAAAPAARRGSPGRQRWASRKRRASRASTGTRRVASAAVSAERSDTRRNARSSSSGSTAAECSAKQRDHDQRAQAEHRAVDERLERDVELPQPRQRCRRATITVSPSRVTSALIDRDQQRERHAPARDRAQHAADARAGGRGGQHAPAAAQRAAAGARTTARRRRARGTTREPTPARAACSGLSRRR